MGPDDAVGPAHSLDEYLTPSPQRRRADEALTDTDYFQPQSKCEVVMRVTNWRGSAFINLSS